MAKIRRPLTWLSAGTRAVLARNASTSRDDERSLGRLVFGIANVPPVRFHIPRYLTALIWARRTGLPVGWRQRRLVPAAPVPKILHGSPKTGLCYDYDDHSRHPRDRIGQSEQRA